MVDRGGIVGIGLCAVWCGWVAWSLAGLEHTAAVQIESQVLPPQRPVGEPALPEIPEIDFTQQSASQALAVVTNAPSERQWMVAFFLGEQVGHHYGRKLDKARWFSDALPKDLRQVFYNGLAHTCPWQIDDPQAQVAAIEASVPEPYRKSAYIGMLIRYAMIHGDDATKVVAFARAFGEERGVDAVDGVRIGVQQRHRRDPAKALDLVAEYPEDFQKAMAEEIGWRVGSEAGLDPAKIIAMADRLAQSSRPRFVHGACRSAWHPGVALAALKPLLSALDDESASQCLTAVGFALAQVGQTNAQVAALGADLGNADWAGVLVTAHSGFEGTEQGWLNPDLGRPSQAR